MLTAAVSLAKRHSVEIFWDREQENALRDEAKRKFALNLDNISFTENIFSSNTSTINRIAKTKEYDGIFYLSDGSLPLSFAKKTIIHFQFPVEWVTLSPKIRLKMLNISKYVCNSQFTKSFIDKKFSVNSATVYPPVTLVEKKTEKEKIILHVGRFGSDREGSNYKKQDVMIEAFKKVSERLKGWKLFMVISVRKEDEEKFSKLKELAENFPIEFVVNTDRETLEEYYARAKMYWHASGFGEDLQKSPEKAEHFGIATVEAMSAGAVPVVIAAGGQAEIVTDGENGLTWSSIGEFIEKTVRIANSEEEWTNLSKNARFRARDFSEERFAKEINRQFE